MINGSIKWVFFGGSEFSVHVLNELLLHDIKPNLIITTPDKPKGRKLILTLLFQHYPRSIQMNLMDLDRDLLY